MAINRAPFNALVDDDGTNTVGSVWNKTQIKNVILDPADVAYAPFASPAFTGTPTAPTAAPSTNTTQLATTAFVTTASAPPAWTAVAYSAANFVGTGGMTWTVDSGDQVRFSYLLVGKTMTVSFWFNSTSLTGTATNEIRMTIPAGKSSAAYSAGIVWLNNPGSLAGVINAPAGQTYLQIYKIDQTNYTLSTNTFLLSGTFTFEVS
jgi:hypothetical protein